MNELIKFNYENIYFKANTKKQIKKYELMFNTVFNKCIYILDNKLTNYNIYINFLNNMDNNYLNNNSNNRIVIDYIAGMTDDYFIKEYNTLKKI